MKTFATRCFSLTALLLAVFCFSIQAQDQDALKKEARASMDPWLKLVDSGNYGASWSAASPFFKKNVTESQWVMGLEKVRTPLGNLKERVVFSSLYQSEMPSPDGRRLKGDYVIAQFKSGFKNLAEAVETVTFEKDTDGRWKASGYYIKPQL